MSSEVNMEYETQDMNFQQVVPHKSCSSPAASPDSSCFAPLMQMNGRKVLSPPKDWVGPPPTSACELYVRHIPRNLNEQKLIQPFLRFGRIYEIRLPMDFNQANRGYAYVKYTSEEDAACAMEVLSHYFVAPHRKLEILHSYEKCRLFVSNIPRDLDEAEIESKFRGIFPTMQRIYTRGGVSLRSSNAGMHVENGTNQENCINCSGGVDMAMGVGGAGAGGDNKMMVEYRGHTNAAGNRGHVFIHFPSHMKALEAKKSTTPGIIRLWGRDLKVVWANNEREADMTKETKTLFVRNVDLTVNNRDIIDLLVQYVPRTTIRKISKVRATAFFDFTTREAAEKCLQQLQGTVLHGQRLDLEWAKPSEQQSLHRMRNTDYDAVLRLKCIANGWQIPIIIFGTYFELEGFQYVAVMLRDAAGLSRAIFCILQPHELVDIHSRMCEVVCVLIETIGAFPDYNYLFFVQKDSAHLLGMVTHNIQKVDFIASHRIPPGFYFDFNELIDLSWAVALLASATEEALLQAYQESFRTHTVCTYLQNWLVLGHRLFGTIMPKYRNKPPLKHNLNDTQIVLSLCFTSTGTNCTLPSRPYIPFPVTYFDSGYDVLPYVTLKLLPIALTQSRFAVNHMLSHIQFGGSQYYHPAQRMMFPPIWVSGCSYSTSIKQPQISMLQQEQQHYQQQQQQPQLHSQSSPSSNGSGAQSPVTSITPNTMLMSALTLPSQNGAAIMPSSPLHMLHS